MKSLSLFRYAYLVKDSECYNSTTVVCGTCLRSTVDTSPALSPVMTEYEDWDTASLNFPTWTESVWKNIGARMFLKGSPGYDLGILALGILLCLISFPLTLWTNRNVRMIFGKVESVEVDNPVPVEM